MSSSRWRRACPTPTSVNDQPRLREVTRRYKDLTPVVDCVRRYHARTADAEAARELLTVATDDERESLRDELADDRGRAGSRSKRSCAC